jgi:hypothetical protein
MLSYPIRLWFPLFGGLIAVLMLVYASCRMRPIALIGALLTVPGIIAPWFLGVFLPAHGVYDDGIQIGFGGCADMLMLVGVFVLLNTVVYSMFHGALLPTGTCVKCGYNLTGLTEPRCPECGTPFAMPPSLDTSDS